MGAHSGHLRLGHRRHGTSKPKNGNKSRVSRSSDSSEDWDRSRNSWREALAEIFRSASVNLAHDHGWNGRSNSNNSNNNNNNNSSQQSRGRGWIGLRGAPSQDLSSTGSVTDNNSMFSGDDDHGYGGEAYVEYEESLKRQEEEEEEHVPQTRQRSSGYHEEDFDASEMSVELGEIFCSEVYAAADENRENQEDREEGRSGSRKLVYESAEVGEELGEGSANEVEVALPNFWFKRDPLEPNWWVGGIHAKRRTEVSFNETVKVTPIPCMRERYPQKREEHFYVHPVTDVWSRIWQEHQTLLPEETRPRFCCPPACPACPFIAHYVEDDYSPHVSG